MTWHKRRIAVGLLFLMASYILPVRVWAQSGADSSVNKSAQDSGQLVPDNPKVNLPRERTGVDDNKRLEISLRDAISMALEHNLDIQIEKDNIKIAEYNL